MGHVIILESSVTSECSFHVIMFVGPLGDALSLGILCNVYKARCCRSSGLGKKQVSLRHREPRPHNRISVTLCFYVRLMVCDMFPTPQPPESAIYEPRSPSHFVTAAHPVVPWPSWLRHRANNAGISGSIPLGTTFWFSACLHFVASG